LEFRGSPDHDVPLSQGYVLIIHFSVAVNEIFAQGKKFAWPRPERCPACSGIRLWGHGYVERYFEGFTAALWMKRFRCFDCSSVHTCRPLDFFKGLRFSAEVVLQCLLNKIEKGRWLSFVVRQNQQYWYRCLRTGSSRQANVIKPALFHLKDFLFGKTSDHFEPLLM
jgi:hypothetical protein